MKNWRIDMILLFLKWIYFIENLIEWQNSKKAYKKQTLEYAEIKVTDGNSRIHNIEGHS